MNKCNSFKKRWKWFNKNNYNNSDYNLMEKVEEDCEKYIMNLKAYPMNKIL